MNDPEEPCGLMGLVAHGCGDVYLHGNPQMSIFDKSYKRTTNSTFTYLKRDLIKTGEIWSMSFTPQKCDIIGDCYLCFTPKNKFSFSDIQSCTISATVKDFKQDLETLTGDTLRILAHENDTVSVEEGNGLVMIPLPFFFTKDPEDFFNLMASQEMNVSIECKLSDNVLNPHIVYNGCFLEADERKKCATQSFEKLCLTCKTVALKFMSDGDGCVTANVSNYFNEQCKDLRLQIEDGTCTKIDVRLNGSLHMSLNSIMTTRIIPKKYYGISKKSDQSIQPIHYIPFCMNPNFNALTSTIHLGRIDSAELKLSGLNANTCYTVHIVGRFYNVMRYMHGMCGFAISSPSDYLSK